MSTYEALVASHEQLGVEFKKLLGEVDELGRVSEICWELIALGRLEMSPRYRHRLALGAARIPEACALIKSAMTDARAYLGEACKFDFVAETATTLGNIPAATQAASQLKERLRLAQLEVDGAGVLVAALRKLLAESQLPMIALA